MRNLVKFFRRTQRQRVMNELLQMDQRLLDDMGLTHADILDAMRTKARFSGAHE
ncbi:DUF1127 domain-containing protein [Devosia sp.]|uniref:DUF1127 domain-containing protein n=1 Tax=Devosia sp. TaxID=1871048 RepID=UPI003A900DBB